MLYFPFDSQVSSYTEDGYPVYDRAVDSSGLSSIINKYFSNGIFPNPSTNFQVVSATGLNVSVLPGSALINGRTCSETNTTSLALSTANSVNPRIDTVVLRLDINTAVRSIGLYIKTGTPSVTPVAPALTRDESIYELGLANISVKANVTTITNADITDTRNNNSRCGIIAGAIQQVDTTTLYNQYQSALDQYLELVQSALDATTAGNLQNQINTKATTSTYSSTLSTTWTGTSAPYTQTVTVDGITSSDTPVVDVVLSTTTATALQQIEAWSFVSKITTGTNSITATCLEDKPTVAIPIQIKVVR